ncbi:alpha/beta fold hydrolase [Bacillus sp. NPDC077027]|uniref:alpha/beta fold hydrolase n=1 Tax=Bacillus sp. NPDC077027 TaxID=3390548 RepID=UPI003CFCEE9C
MNQKPIMILLHGGGVSSWMWKRQIEMFSNDYDCYTPDLLGHGKRANEQPFSMKESAIEVLEWMDEHAHDRSIILIGFSLGAQIAVEILSRKPNRVDFAIINSALVIPLPWLYLLVKPILPLMYPLLKKDWFIQLQAEKIGIPKEDVADYADGSKSLQKRTLQSMFKENLHYRLPNTFQQASTRILITVGDLEKNIMKRSAQHLTEAHPQAVGVIVPSVGHSFTFEKAELFYDMVKSWIDEKALPEELIVITKA